MRAYTFNINTSAITKRLKKEQAWLLVPKNEPKFKAAPFIEIYLEETPKKQFVTAIRVPFAELKSAMKLK